MEGRNLLLSLCSTSQAGLIQSTAEISWYYKYFLEKEKSLLQVQNGHRLTTNGGRTVTALLHVQHSQFNLQNPPLLCQTFV